jgi:hypothetical protein
MVEDHFVRRDDHGVGSLDRGLVLGASSGVMDVEHGGGLGLWGTAGYI